MNCFADDVKMRIYTVHVHTCRFAGECIFISTCIVKLVCHAICSCKCKVGSHEWPHKTEFHYKNHLE